MVVVTHGWHDSNSIDLFYLPSSREAIITAIFPVADVDADGRI